MRRSQLVRTGALPGTLAGVAGGLAFGAAMIQLGYLPTVASLVRTNTAEAGFIVHMIIAAIIGAGFGMLVRDQRLGAGEMLFWGLTYGSLWWFLGPLTLLPLLRGGVVVWDVATAQAAFPSLLGHLWYGAVTAIAYAALRRQAESTPGVGAGTLLLGVLAGLAGAWLLGRLLDVQAQWLVSSGMVNTATHRAAGPATLLIGLGAGVGFALLYPQLKDGSGPVLIRGTMYGFAWWVAGALTLMPLISGGTLAWSLDAVRARFPALPGFVLSGAFVATEDEIDVRSAAEDRVVHQGRREAVVHSPKVAVRSGHKVGKSLSAAVVVEKPFAKLVSWAGWTYSHSQKRHVFGFLSSCCSGAIRRCAFPSASGCGARSARICRPIAPSWNSRRP